jgi:cytosine deaminase
VGGPADLLVDDTERTVDLLARHAVPRIRAGRVLAG